MMLQRVFEYTQETTYSGIARSIYGKGFEVFVDVIQVCFCAPLKRSSFIVLVLVVGTPSLSPTNFI